MLEFFCAYAVIGFVVFTLCWKLIWYPIVFKGETNALMAEAVVLGIIMWPVFLGVSSLLLTGFGIYKFCKLVGPVVLDRYMNWMNGVKKKNEIKA